MFHQAQYKLVRLYLRRKVILPPAFIYKFGTSVYESYNTLQLDHTSPARNIIPLQEEGESTKKKKHIINSAHKVYVLRITDHNHL